MSGSNNITSELFNNGSDREDKAHHLIDVEVIWIESSRRATPRFIWRSSDGAVCHDSRIQSFLLTVNSTYWDLQCHPTSFQQSSSKSWMCYLVRVYPA